MCVKMRQYCHLNILEIKKSSIRQTFHFLENNSKMKHSSHLF